MSKLSFPNDTLSWFHQHMRACCFFCKTRWEEAFTGEQCLANGPHFWQMANKSGKIEHSCLKKFSSFRVGETERRIFCQKAVHRQLLAWQIFFDEIEPWWKGKRHLLFKCQLLVNVLISFKYSMAMAMAGHIMLVKLNIYEAKHRRPQTFFQGRAKFSRGQKHYICQKHPKTLYFPQKKSKNMLFCTGGRRGARAPSCSPLLTPMRLNIF